MKKLLFFTAVLALCACAKEVPAPQSSDEASIPMTEESAFLETTDMPVLAEVSCKELADKLQACEPAFCMQNTNIDNTVLTTVMKVNGNADGKCSYTETRDAVIDGTSKSQVTRVCIFQMTQLPIVADYLDKIFTPEGDVNVESEVSLTGIDANIETVTGEKLINPFMAYLNDGTCTIPAMAYPDSGDGRVRSDLEEAAMAENY